MSNAPIVEKIQPHRAGLLAGVFVTLIIVALHVHFFVRVGGFWRDEINLINLAKRPTLNLLTHDSFPALMPVVVHVWTWLAGGRDIALRLFGMFIGLGIVGALWATVWLTRRSAPLVSLALLGLNSIVISYGDSLRAYGLGSLLIVLTAGVMWLFLQKPTWSRAGWLAVLAALSVQALYQNAVLVAAICAGGWTICLRCKLWPAAGKILVAGLVAAASLLPYWSNIFPAAGPAIVLRGGFQSAEAFTNLDTALAFPMPPYLYVWGACALVVVGLGCLRLRVNLRATTVAGDGELPLFAGVTLLVGLVGFVWFLWYAAIVTQPWHYLPLLALTAVCFDLGLPLTQRQLRALLFGLTVATAIIAIPFAHRDLKWRFTNVDLLAKKLTAEAAPKDFILVSPWFCGLPFDRYYKGTAEWNTIPPITDHALHYYNLVHDQMKTPHAMRPVLEQISAVLQNGHRVWLVGRVDIPAPGSPAPADLPLPPLKWTGWSDTPYNLIWEAQITHFLSDRSRRFECLPADTNVWVNFNENLQLFVAEGWQTNVISAPPTVLPIK